MTNDEKAKAYEMALEAARKELGVDRKEWEVVQRVLHNIFSELAESEDERIRKWILEKVQGYADSGIPCSDEIQMANKALSWLEKQKEPEKEELAYRLNGLMQEYINEAKDQEEEEHRFKCYKLFWNALEDASYFEQKEQKPISTEDMPYVADEHFFEREPADTFKYRLAEYMTKNCKKGEGPYGYSYNISSESILQMAKEELIKRGELKEPQTAGWSEEDEKMRQGCIDSVEYELLDNGMDDEVETDPRIAWLKSLRPSWKPSEEQMDALNTTYTYLFNQTNGVFPCLHTLESLYEQLKKLT